MKGERQTRTINAVEIRSEEIDGKKYIYGFIPYNEQSQKMWLSYSDDEIEVLDPAVFNKTLGDKSKVLANVNHDDGKILGNTKAGTLELTNTEKGLECRCELGNSSWARDTWDVISRGDVTTMSFEFLPFDWVEGWMPNVTLLRSAQLKAVSFLVSNPAYLGTDSFSALRSLCRDANFNNLDKDKIDKKEVENLIGKLTNLINRDATPASDSAEPSGQAEAIPTDSASRANEASNEVPQQEEKPADDTNAQALKMLALELDIESQL